MGTRVDQVMPSKIQSRPIILLTITKFKLSNAYKISMVTTTRFCTHSSHGTWNDISSSEFWLSFGIELNRIHQHQNKSESIALVTDTSRWSKHYPLTNNLAVSINHSYCKSIQMIPAKFENQTLVRSSSDFLSKQMSNGSNSITFVFT